MGSPLQGSVTPSQFNSLQTDVNPLSEVRAINADTLKGIINTSSTTVINFVGDSIMEGLKASPNFKDGGFAGLLRTYLQNKYGSLGGGYTPYYYPYGSPSMIFTGSWNYYNGFGTTNIYAQSVAGAGSSVEFDINGIGVEVYYSQGALAGTYDLYSDGVLIESVDTIGSANPINSHVTRGLSDGPHHIKLVNTGSKALFLLGFREVTSNTIGVLTNMCGRYGTKTTDAIPANSLACTEYFNPNLTIIAYLANDSSIQLDIATYTSNLLTLINSAQKNGGKVLLIADGVHYPTTTPLTEIQYTNAMRAVAIKKGCAFVDINYAWGYDGYIANALSYLGDGVHPSTAGHVYIYKIIKYMLGE
ncbi:MAG: SGNH/GDSL hydrolase family protein [Bacillota bacterium]|nr:SGNH/GDSL hydrolase family protein [Bacillota bacterium]